jgi:hypothetical protein
MCAADVYCRFIEAVNRKDLQEAERVVDPKRYQDNCVGLTLGFVHWEKAKASIRHMERPWACLDWEPCFSGSRFSPEHRESKKCPLAGASNV